MAGKSAKTASKLLLALLIVAVIAAAVWYLMPNGDELPEHIASGNGRIEATEVDIATRIPGRLESFEVREGDMVEAGQLLAVMDTDELKARAAAAEANLHQAEQARLLAEAVVVQRESEQRYARAELARIETLVDRGHASREQLDRTRTAAETAGAALQAARVQVASADAGIESARAAIRQIQTNIDDSQLSTPVGGRVLYRLAEPGEVLAGGGKVATVLDVTDVYMTFFLPERLAGRVAMGSDARIIIDAAPEYVIPATISYVASVAQFTPKSVETEQEREKMMFRIRARIDPALLEEHIEQVKTGLPGVAWLKLDADADWPAELEVNVGH